MLRWVSPFQMCAADPRATAMRFSWFQSSMFRSRRKLLQITNKPVRGGDIFNYAALSGYYSIETLKRKNQMNQVTLTV